MVFYDLYSVPSPYYDMDDSYVYMIPHEQMRWRQEARRRQLLQQRAREEYERRLREEYEHQRRLEETQRRYSREQEIRRKAEQRRRYFDDEDEDDVDAQQPSHRIVVGPDGHLYSIPLKVSRSPHKTSTKFNKPKATQQKQSDEQEEVVEKRSETVEVKKAKNTTEEVNNNTPAKKSEEARTKQKKDNISTELQQLSKLDISKSKNGRRKKIIRTTVEEIVVEDASDSEYEEDELRSVWRNRLPSPGQWMEPVLSYQQES